MFKNLVLIFMVTRNTMEYDPAGLRRPSQWQDDITEKAREGVHHKNHLCDHIVIEGSL